MLIESTRFGRLDVRDDTVLAFPDGLIGLPGTIGQFQQSQQQIPALLTLDQSILLVWPQVVVLFAIPATKPRAAAAAPGSRVNPAQDLLFMRSTLR